MTPESAAGRTAAASMPAAAASLRSGMIVGVGTHMGQAGSDGSSRQSVEAVAAAISALGVGALRDEVYWGDFENPRGRYALSNATPQMRAAIESGLFANGVLVLGYSSRWHGNGARPTTPALRAAYTAYAAELARATAGRIGFLEVWNEWNLAIGGFPSPGSVTDYVALARGAIPALRKAAPSARVLVGGLADPETQDWAFVRGLVADGVLSLADGLSVHLYNFSRGGAATSTELIDRLETLQRIVAAGNGGRPYPIYVTETGWPTSIGRPGVREETAGALVARFLLEAQGLPWLKGVWIYELFDSGEPGSSDHDFGLYRTAGTPKAGACFVKGALALARRFRYVGKGVTNAVRWLQFEGEGRTLLVQFTERVSATSSLEMAVRPESLCGWDPDAPPVRRSGSHAIGALPQVTSFVGERLDASTLVSR